MGLLKWFRRYLSCSRCHGTGVYTHREVIPRDQLSARERAEVMIEGGYFYRPVVRFCDQPGCPARARKR